ncbi:MAG: NTP/NDP exchange transporter [Oscillospiraceae bacterium]|jgi:AAA family ATP:ADP antiporter|nr:NTP/NDP exchange transporter [Oscillospiraceae bacterium]
MSGESGDTKTTEFGKVRAALWPIHGYEMKKFLPMSFMMFCILFVYTLVRDLKDTLLVNAPGGGAKSIPALKLYGVLPFAMIAVVVFGKLLGKFGSRKTFYITVFSFLIFYAIFGFILYPIANNIHLSEGWIKNMQKSTPGLFYEIWPLIGNWSFALFYIISEIWGSLVISSLFWQFANQTTKKDEVKRFYGLFACVGNLGLICSGFFAKLSTKFESIRVLMQMTGVLIVGLIIVYLYYYVNKNVLTDPKFYDPSQIKAKKKKAKLSLGESFKAIFKSGYLLLITILVVAYGVAINISEVVWKDQGKLFYGSSSKFNNMMADLSIVTGIVTIIITLTCSNVLRKCKWKTAALVTPISVLILGGAFFLLIMQENNNGINSKIFGFVILELVVYVGLVQDAISKGIKYSLFDSTKQMAYIPLDSELKTTGQAAVEVVGGRFGKSLGSIVITVLGFIFTGRELSSLVNILSGVLFLVVFSWIFSVFSLSKKYETLKEQRHKEDLQQKEEA